MKVTSDISMIALFMITGTRRKNSQLHPLQGCTSGIKRQSRQKGISKNKTKLKVLMTLLPHTYPGNCTSRKHENARNTRIYQFTGDRQNNFTS